MGNEDVKEDGNKNENESENGNENEKWIMVMAG